jgi:hypothetical protein
MLILVLLNIPLIPIELDMFGHKASLARVVCSVKHYREARPGLPATGPNQRQLHRLEY